MWSLEDIIRLNNPKQTKGTDMFGFKHKCNCNVKPKVKISALDSDFIPVYKHEGDAGADVKAYSLKLAEDHESKQLFSSWTYDEKTNTTVDWAYELRPGEPTLFNCGFSCELPEGYTFMVCPRSGLALKEGITVLNAPGICDAGYRGEYGVILFNTSQYSITIHKGDRIAQIVLVKTPQAEFVVEELSESDRGTGGFGSSGKK